MKIVILGYSGSGKSTLARTLGSRFELPVLHLDRVHWLPGWKEQTKTAAQAEVARFMNQPSWIIDGNYSRYLLENRLDEADLVFFLDFGRFICLTRVIKRYIMNHGQTRLDMGEGCLEKLDLEFIWWVLYRGRDKAHRSSYQQTMKRVANKLVVLRNQAELSAFLEKPKEFILK